MRRGGKGRVLVWCYIWTVGGGFIFGWFVKFAWVGIVLRGKPGVIFEDDFRRMVLVLGGGNGIWWRFLFSLNEMWYVIREYG